MWGRLSAGTMSNLSDLPKVKDEPHVQREEGKKSHHKATKDTKVISSPRAWDHAEPRSISCAWPKRSDRPHVQRGRPLDGGRARSIPRPLWAGVRGRGWRAAARRWIGALTP